MDGLLGRVRTLFSTQRTGMAVASLSLMAATPAMAAPDTWTVADAWRASPSPTHDWSTSLDRQINTASLSDGADASFTQEIHATEISFQSSHFTERLSIRQLVPAAGSETSPWRNLPMADSANLDLAYQRDWTPAHRQLRHGLEVALTPHAGVTYGAEGATAQAGATLRIGKNLRDLAPDGDDAFGDRPRWYLFAAGSRTAVGYNLQRGRDGELARSGFSHDKGGSIGDATIGVAYRRGPIETSLGLVYRENQADGLRKFEGLRNDVDEGILAFQFAFRPR